MLKKTFHYQNIMIDKVCEPDNYATHFVYPINQAIIEIIEHH